MVLPDAFHYAHVNNDYATPVQEIQIDTSPVTASLTGTWNEQISPTETVTHHITASATTTDGAKHSVTAHGVGQEVPLAQPQFHSAAEVTYIYGVRALGFAPNDLVIPYTISFQGSLATNRSSAGPSGYPMAYVSARHKAGPQANPTTVLGFNCSENNSLPVAFVYPTTMVPDRQYTLEIGAAGRLAGTGSYYAHLDPVFTIDPDFEFYYQGRWWPAKNYYEWEFSPGILPEPATLGLLAAGGLALLARHRPRDARRRRS
jgi:hypothetical protein